MERVKERQAVKEGVAHSCITMAQFVGRSNILAGCEGLIPTVPPPIPSHFTFVLGLTSLDNSSCLQVVRGEVRLGRRPHDCTDFRLANSLGSGIQSLRMCKVFERCD